MKSDPRRAALFLLAVIGLGMAATVTDPGWVFNPDRAILHESMPIWLRFSLWGSSSLVAMAGAVWPRWQHVGFAAAVLMPVERAVGYSWAWVAYLIPGLPNGDRMGWAHALVWAGYAALIMMIARASTREVKAGD